MSDVDDRLRQVEVLVAEVRTGQRPPEDFASRLRDLLGAIEEQEQKIRRIEVPAEALEGLKEELGAGFRGIARFRDGLQRLLAWGGEASVLDEGLGMVREGNAMLNEAVRLNRANRAELERLYGDLSASQ